MSLLAAVKLVVKVLEKLSPDDRKTVLDFASKELERQGDPGDEQQ